MLRIEDFNICTSSADNDIFFNDKFREAITMAINYQIDEYYKQQLQRGIDEELDPDKMTLYLYPETVEYRLEIKDRENNPTISLTDSIREWLEIIEEPC